MPTILRRIFQPKWQSRNPRNRLEAIENLNWTQEDHRSILRTLAETDPEPEVRRKAITKIVDGPFLLKLWPKADTALREALVQRLAALLEVPGAHPGLPELVQSQADDALGYQLINQLSSLEAKLSLLEKIQDQRILAEIAIQANASRLRQRAAERLQDPEILEQVIKNAKNKDKGVYQTVKATLQALRDQEREQQQRQQQLEELCAALEAHATSEALHLYEAKFDALASQWQKLAATANADQTGRAERAIRTCAARVEKLREEAIQREQELQRQQEQQRERQATLETLEQAQARLRDKPVGEIAPIISNLDALLKTQENRWLEATRGAALDPSEQKTYQQLMQQLRRYHNALRQYAAQESRIRELADALGQPEAQDPRPMRQLLEQIQWPQAFPAPDLLQQASARLEQVEGLRQQEANNLRQLRRSIDDLLERLERALDERALKQSSQIYKEAQRLLQKLPESVEQSYQARFRLLHGRLQELRDWAGFATRPKQQELCERMEQLAGQPLEPQLKAERIKELQEEWRALGGSSDQSLWHRFKDASDKAYEPCRAYFEEQERLKQSNLEQREKLCEQLEQLIARVDWNQADWKAMDQISRKAREEWQSFQPVDHKRNKPVQKRFRQLIDELERHLNEERARNAALKSAIVQQAEALVDAPDVRAATQEAKALQKQWQAIGLTAPREDRQLWLAFRAACDRIFARLAEQKAGQHQEMQQRVQQAERICAALEQLTTASDTDAETRLQQLRQEFQDLGPLPRDSQQALQERFRAAVQAVRQAIRQHRSQYLLASWRTLAQEAERLAQFEDEIIAGRAANQLPALELPAGIPDSIRDGLQARVSKAPQANASDYDRNERPARILALRAEIALDLDSPAEERQLRMAYQMERLSGGFNGGQQESTPWNQMMGILAEWYGLGPVRPELRQALQARIDQALAQAISHSL